MAFPKRLWRWFRRRRWWQQGLLALLGLVGAAGAAFAALTLYSQSQSNSTRYIRRWFDDAAQRPALTTPRERCGDAPFVLPSEGLVGLLWADPAAPYNVLRRHSGIDIFGDGAPGTVPVVAAYEGYLTRLQDWKSTVIIRHDDPLHPGDTIWTYYTHMASRDGDKSYIDAAFPPGTTEQWVAQGALLGYQGDYSGSAIPVGLHVHFSIVQSDSGGSFKNESRVANTLDPSPYFGLPLNIAEQSGRPIRCADAG
jgi:hypothetical protein